MGQNTKEQELLRTQAILLRHAGFDLHISTEKPSFEILGNQPIRLMLGRFMSCSVSREGLEPSTNGLKVRCSTIELPARKKSGMNPFLHVRQQNGVYPFFH